MYYLQKMQLLDCKKCNYLKTIPYICKEIATNAKTNKNVSYCEQRKNKQKNNNNQQPPTKRINFYCLFLK